MSTSPDHLTRARAADSDRRRNRVFKAPDWSGQPGLALPDAWEHGMDDALDAAVADTPDTEPLRALLAGSLHA
ncbi:hypothetical protein AB0K51_28985 [Kitasatospora sp. NPDC049285]|uniref:hypothetical protein n=1 Tax=Kitasatospora sp. NPDC049285 TaxID=3157096 RepID=UPI003425741F